MQVITKSEIAFINTLSKILKIIVGMISSAIQNIGHNYQTFLISNAKRWKLFYILPPISCSNLCSTPLTGIWKQPSLMLFTKTKASLASTLAQPLNLLAETSKSYSSKHRLASFFSLGSAMQSGGGFRATTQSLWKIDHHFVVAICLEN